MQQRPVEPGASIPGVEETVRKTLEPSRLSTYLENPFTTATIPANTPTKLLVPTTGKYVRDFELDIPNMRWFLNDENAVGRLFTVAMTTSISSSSGNTDVTLEMYKNGVKEPGINIERKVGFFSDLGQMSLIGSFDLDHDDYIEIYVTVDQSVTLTFEHTAINIIEVN